MFSTFKAWIRYFGFAIQTIIFDRRSPGRVIDDEDVAREIFYSGCVKADGKLRRNAFGLNRKKDSAWSVNRASLAAPKFLRFLGLKHGRQRNLKYYGSAHISARAIRDVVPADNWSADVIGSLNCENPFHADIPYPPSHQKDYEMDVQLQLAEAAFFQPEREPS